MLQIVSYSLLVLLCSFSIRSYLIFCYYCILKIIIYIWTWKKNFLFFFFGYIIITTINDGPVTIGLCKQIVNYLLRPLTIFLEKMTFFKCFKRDTITILNDERYELEEGTNLLVHMTLLSSQVVWGSIREDSTRGFSWLWVVFCKLTHLGHPKSFQTKVAPNVVPVKLL